MKLLYGTGNEAKLTSMRDMLDSLDIEIIGLNDVDIQIGWIDESGNDPLENARIKALAYYKAVKMPLFSCDSGLYIEGVDPGCQPGVHVRRVSGRVLNDEEMIEYYTSLAERFGGRVKAKYKNAICLIMDEEHIYEYDGEDISSAAFLLAPEAHPCRTPGFPLDSISLDMESGKYYMDLDSNNNSLGEKEMARGFKAFFLRAIGKEVAPR